MNNPDLLILEAGSGEQRQKPAQADPKQVKKLKGEKKKRAELALPTGAIPAKDKKAGTAVSRRLQRGAIDATYHGS